MTLCTYQFGPFQMALIFYVSRERVLRKLTGAKRRVKGDMAEHMMGHRRSLSNG